MFPDEENEKTRGCTVARCRTVILAVMVRLVLILHNLLCVWRVVTLNEHNGYWALACANILILIEGALVLYHNGGVEWKWWCPCFAAYLVATLPPIWLLQLAKYYDAVEELAARYTVSSTTSTVAMVTGDRLENVTQTNFTTYPNVTMATTKKTGVAMWDMFNLENDTWVVIVMDALIYLIVFSRWLLPRAGLSHEALADLVLEFLGTASDIMELLAIFDEDRVLTNLPITYAILAIWSFSFFQFVPSLAYNREFKKLHTRRMRKIQRACGDSFSEVTSTCISIFMQDGPFLCLRLYIMISLDLISYSILFFVLKNIVTLMILFYRLGTLCIALPCCYKDEGDILSVEEVDFSKPVLFGHQNLIHRHSALSSNGSINSANDISAFPYLVTAKS